MNANEAASNLMPTPKFSPGFRLSRLDAFVLFVGGAGAAIACFTVPWIAAIVALVLVHFFLFCNVFRVSRSLELIWASVFVLLAGGTIIFEYPGWLTTAAASLFCGLIVIACEMRKPSYHGVLWRQINPTLPQWWDMQIAAKDEVFPTQDVASVD